jgi:hypothetical protein
MAKTLRNKIKPVNLSSKCRAYSSNNITLQMFAYRFHLAIAATTAPVPRLFVVHHLVKTTFKDRIIGIFDGFLCATTHLVIRGVVVGRGESFTAIPYNQQHKSSLNIL